MFLEREGGTGKPFLDLVPWRVGCVGHVGGHLQVSSWWGLAFPKVSECILRLRSQSLRWAMAVGHLLALAELGVARPKFLKAESAGVFPGVVWDGLRRSGALDLPEPV